MRHTPLLSFLLGFAADDAAFLSLYFIFAFYFAR